MNFVMGGISRDGSQQSFLKMLILFQCFLRFACHGDYLLGMPLPYPTCPWVKITCLWGVHSHQLLQRAAGLNTGDHMGPHHAHTCALSIHTRTHLSGDISPLISSSILGTYRTQEFLFQYPIILGFHTVHGVLKARILEWVAMPFSR